MSNPQQAPPWRKLLAENTTSNAAFATPNKLTLTAGAWTTVPAGAAVIDTQLLAQNVWLRFFGTDADGEAGEVRISPVRFAGREATSLWVPTPLCAYTFTFGPMPGDADTNALAADYYAETVARLGDLGVENVTDTITDATGLGVPASLLYDCRSSRYHLIELRRDSAASVNAEWTLVNG